MLATIIVVTAGVSLVAGAYLGAWLYRADLAHHKARFTFNGRTWLTVDKDRYMDLVTSRCVSCGGRTSRNDGPQGDLLCGRCSTTYVAVPEG